MDDLQCDPTLGATGAGTPVNAYIISGTEGTVVVDSTLTVSDGRALRARVDALGKPLLGVVVTHAHPDHYGGLASLLAGLPKCPYSRCKAWST